MLQKTLLLGKRRCCQPMRLNVLPVHLPDAIRGLGFLKQPRVSFRFVPLHYCELRQQTISTEAKPNEQVGVEAAFWELPHDSCSATKLAIPVTPHYENVIPPELELLNIIRADSSVFKAAFGGYEAATNRTDAQSWKPRAAL